MTRVADRSSGPRDAEEGTGGMAGVLDGLRVLDVSRGVAGPMTAMLLADHGALVTRVEAPAPSPGTEPPGHRVWNRGKRSAVLDLRTEEGRRALHALAGRSDVLIESCPPARRPILGLDPAVLAALNPRLVHCSITAYGETGPDRDRPGYDALVAARTGLQWEKRGWPGGGVNRLSGSPDPLEGIGTPEGVPDGPGRDGPLFSWVPLPSLGAFYLASAGIAAALLARHRTGRGQHVRTSLAQGAMASVIGGWQRVERPFAGAFQSWVFDGRTPAGIYRCADGRHVHHWVPNPGWVLAMGELESLDDAPDDVIAATSHRDDPARLGTDPANLVVLHHYHPLMAAAFARHPADEWVRAAARKGAPLQIVRAPAEALADPWWIADGCVAELDDPVEGPIRVVGRTYSTGPGTGHPRGAAPVPGEHTAEILAEAARAEAETAARPGPSAPPRPAARGPVAGPLAGIRVLDLGLALAGPYGCQVLADLGADVVKVNAPHDGYWQSSHIAMTANRNKRSLAVDLKDPRGLAVLHRLVAGADVVHHNMRYSAAVRLGVDEESLREINPRLVYCHTRGFEEAGPRTRLPGNDQTAAALAGVEWEDGAVGAGGRPMWSRAGFGDTGNGLLSAIGVMHALAHRERTGEGLRVDTSIVYAQLLAVSGTHLRADGGEPARPRLDAGQFGFGPAYRLYRCAGDTWLCLAAVAERHRAALARAIGRPGLFELDRETQTAVLEEVFAARAAATWSELLDAAGVPAEISDPDFPARLLADPEMAERGWTAEFDHPHVGRMRTAGLGLELSETPATLRRPSPMVGEHSREVLLDAGFDPGDVDRLIAAGVVREYVPDLTR